MSDSYAALVRQLAQLTAQVDAQRAEADSWQARQCAAAEQAVARAEEAVRDAEAELSDARQRVAAVDAEAAHLWQTLRGRLGTVARRFADPPAPVPGATGDPATLLDNVHELLERARQPRDLATSAYPLLVGLGVLGAAAAYGLALGARVAGARWGGDLATGMPVLGLVVTLLGPLVGLAPAKLLADRRHATLDARSVAVVLAAGLLATGVLFALLR